MTTILVQLTRMEGHFAPSHVLLRLIAVDMVPRAMQTRLTAASANANHLGLVQTVWSLQFALQSSIAMAMVRQPMKMHLMDVCAHVKQMSSGCGAVMIVPFHQLAPVQTIAVGTLSSLVQTHVMDASVNAAMDGPVTVATSLL
jgi:hypothetical protein